jgi:hypothetical protein
MAGGAREGLHADDREEGECSQKKSERVGEQGSGALERVQDGGRSRGDEEQPARAKDREGAEDEEVEAVLILALGQSETEHRPEAEDGYRIDAVPRVAEVGPTK